MFDEALSRVEVGPVGGRFGPIGTMGSEDPEEVRETGPASGFSAIVVTAAVAAGGYRLALRPFDRGRRSSWSARSTRAWNH